MLVVWVFLFLACFVGPLPEVYSQIALLGIFIALPFGWFPGLLIGVLWELRVRKRAGVHDAEPSASPNGGLAAPSGRSGLGEGPPSVS